MPATTPGDFEEHLPEGQRPTRRVPLPPEQVRSGDAYTYVLRLTDELGLPRELVSVYETSLGKESGVQAYIDIPRARIVVHILEDAPLAEELEQAIRRIAMRAQLLRIFTMPIRAVRAWGAEEWKTRC